MDKDNFLKIRLPQALKASIEDIAKALNQPVSEVAREALQVWVDGKQHLTNEERVTVAITRPAGYDEGAWRAIIRLKRHEEGLVHGEPLSFFLPELPKRRVSSDKEYRTVLPTDRGHVLGGRFVDGLWEGHIYTNGCPEDENPTKINRVESALKDAIVEILDRRLPARGS